MSLPPKAEATCSNPPADHSDLKALFLNTTLKTAPEPSLNPLQPLLRRPAAIPLMVSWMPRRTFGSSTPARCLRKRSICR